MFKLQLTSVVLATLLATAQMTSHAQTANPGASAATNAAIGGVSQGVVVAAVVGVAMVAAINSGSSGAVMPNPGTPPVDQQLFTSANAAVVQAAVASDNIANAADALSFAGSSLQNNSAYIAASNEVRDARQALTAAVDEATRAVGNLSVASQVDVVGVVSNGVTICAAANSCTLAELRLLELRVVESSQLVVERTRAAIIKIQNLVAVIERDLPSFPVANASAAIIAAKDAFIQVRTAANIAVERYNTVSAGSGTVLTPSTGTIPASGTTGTV
jgi:hypothetical protein